MANTWKNRTVYKQLQSKLFKQWCNRDFKTKLLHIESDTMFKDLAKLSVLIVIIWWFFHWYPICKFKFARALHIYINVTRIIMIRILSPFERFQRFPNEEFLVRKTMCNACTVPKRQHEVPWASFSNDCQDVLRSNCIFSTFEVVDSLATPSEFWYISQGVWDISVNEFYHAKKQIHTNL